MFIKFTTDAAPWKKDEVVGLVDGKARGFIAAKQAVAWDPRTGAQPGAIAPATGPAASYMKGLSDQQRKVVVAINKATLIAGVVLAESERPVTKAVNKFAGFGRTFTELEIDEVWAIMQAAKPKAG